MGLKPPRMRRSLIHWSLHTCWLIDGWAGIFDRLEEVQFHISVAREVQMLIYQYSIYILSASFQKHVHTHTHTDTHTHIQTIHTHIQTCTHTRTHTHTCLLVCFITYLTYEKWGNWMTGLMGFIYWDLFGFSGRTVRIDTKHRPGHVHFWSWLSRGPSPFYGVARRMRSRLSVGYIQDQFPTIPSWVKQSFSKFWADKSSTNS